MHDDSEPDGSLETTPMATYDRRRLSRSGSDPHRNPGGAAWGGQPSIAVLPFIERDARAGNSFIGDAITEDIIAALVPLPDVFVISRMSTLRYRNAPVDVPLIGRELGV